MRRGAVLCGGGPREVSRQLVDCAVGGSARAEFEYAIDAAEAAEILATLCVGRVEKTRHYVEQGELVWEIDEFSGDNAGLTVAELELESVDQTFDRPDWLGQEVTDQRRYYNHSLSQHPYRQWSDAEHDHAN